jgi:1-acyl-sn-glycerol-3-phosphate acyltransferase
MQNAARPRNKKPKNNRQSRNREPRRFQRLPLRFCVHAIPGPSSSGLHDASTPHSPPSRIGDPEGGVRHEDRFMHQRHGPPTRTPLPLARLRCGLRAATGGATHVPAAVTARADANRQSGSAKSVDWLGWRYRRRKGRYADRGPWRSRQMTIDRFRRPHRNALVAFRPAAAERFYRVIEWFAQRLHVEVHGIENIPRGRALLVANHSFGWDVLFATGAIWRDTRSPVWALGEHVWWKVPFVRRLASAVGTVDGTTENVDTLLSRDELVLVLPGGLREAVKPRELRYRLLWGHRYGFVRAAIRNQAPIVPLAAIGADDLFDFVGNAYRRGERWLRRTGIPIPLPSCILPIPHLAPLRFVIGEPIPPPAPEKADDETSVRRLRHEVEGALHEMIEVELARRVGIDL